MRKENKIALEFMEWIGEIVRTQGIHLAVEGKALRGAMEKVKNFWAPMVLNAIEAVTGLVVAHLPIRNKSCEIMVIPELLKLLDIQESTVTADAVGTQTRIMNQILFQKGHFVLKEPATVLRRNREILRGDVGRLKKDVGRQEI